MKTWNCFRPRVEELERRLVPSTLTYSTNWSGYAVSTSAGAVSHVAGSWVVPTVATNVSGYSSAWVGIDGVTSSTVEQTGTDSDYVNGQAQYYAWYEMYPAGFVKLNLAIHPGDKISASVTNTSPSQFALSITDVTTGGSFSTTQTSSQAQRSSAEWIQEAPSSVAGVLPLANFGTINFSGANATVSGTSGPADNPWSGSTLYQIDMVTKRGAFKVTTSALSDSGSPSTSSFSVTWVSSGAGGGGGHKHSSNVPPPNSSSIPSPVSATAAGLAASLLGTSPAFPATQSPAVTVASPAGVALRTLPASGAVTATFARLALDNASLGGGADDQENMPELPIPSESDEPQTDGFAAPQTDQPSANLPGASLDRWATDAGCADDFWLSAASLDGALDGGQDAVGQVDPQND